MKQAVYSFLPDFSALFSRAKEKSKTPKVVNNLSDAEFNKEYRIHSVVSKDEKIVHFLFTLGCYEGESITLISILSENYLVSIKDARYSIDLDLAKAIKLA